MLSGSCGTRDRPYIFALPGAPAQRDLGWVLPRLAVASLLPALAVRAVWRWNGSFSDICWLRLFFWEGPLFCCEGDGPWLMIWFVLSCFLWIGMMNGCVCRLFGGGLMTLLSGTKGLGIFGRLRLLRMLAIL